MYRNTFFTELNEHLLHILIKIIEFVLFSQNVPPIVFLQTFSFLPNPILISKQLQITKKNSLVKYFCAIVRETRISVPKTGREIQCEAVASNDSC
jgi:hypothetical protein